MILTASHDKSFIRFLIVFERDPILALKEVKVAERVACCRDSSLIVGLGVETQRVLQITERLVGMPLFQECSAATER